MRIIHSRMYIQAKKIAPPFYTSQYDLYTTAVLSSIFFSELGKIYATSLECPTLQLIPFVTDNVSVYEFCDKFVFQDIAEFDIDRSI